MDLSAHNLLVGWLFARLFGSVREMQKTTVEERERKRGVVRRVVGVGR